MASNNNWGKNAKKAAKKAHRAVAWIAIFFLAIGFAAGYFGAEYLGADDCFVLIGETEITVPLGSAYIYAEHGAKIISLGRDISSDVIIDSELTADENGNYPIDTSVERTYVITYTIDDIRYSGVKKIRTITVTGGQ